MGDGRLSNRLGRWSAITVFLIGVAYLVTLATGFVVHGLAEPIVDPILAIMEVLTLMSAPPMVVLMAAIHDSASVNRKIYGVIAVAFTILFAGTTSVESWSVDRWRSLRCRYRRTCSRKHATSTGRRARVRWGAPGCVPHAGQAVSWRTQANMRKPNVTELRARNKPRAARRPTKRS